VLQGERARTLAKKTSMEHRARKGNIMKWLWAALLTSLGVMSAEAYTCADVRSLSLEQQAYYVRAFDITPAQQERIRHACYGLNTRPVITSVGVSISHLAHGEPDARIGQ